MVLLFKVRVAAVDTRAAWWQGGVRSVECLGLCSRWLRIPDSVACVSAFLRVTAGEHAPVCEYARMCLSVGPGAAAPSRRPTVTLFRASSRHVGRAMHGASRRVVMPYCGM